MFGVTLIGGGVCVCVCVCEGHRNCEFGITVDYNVFLR